MERQKVFISDSRKLECRILFSMVVQNNMYLFGYANATHLIIYIWSLHLHYTQVIMILP